jgi:hypothetical protein
LGAAQADFAPSGLAADLIARPFVLPAERYDDMRFTPREGLHK